MYVSLNISLIISLTLFQSSLSSPHPMRGMANFFTPCSSQCCFIAFSELRSVSYVGLWKYLGFVTYIQIRFKKLSCWPSSLGNDKHFSWAWLKYKTRNSVNILLVAEYLEGEVFLRACSYDPACRDEILLLALAKYVHFIVMQHNYIYI